MIIIPAMARAPHKAAQFSTQGTSYDWPLNNTNLTCTGPVTYGYFLNKYSIVL